MHKRVWNLRHIRHRLNLQVYAFNVSLGLFKEDPRPNLEKALKFHFHTKIILRCLRWRQCDRNIFSFFNLSATLAYWFCNIYSDFVYRFFVISTPLSEVIRRVRCRKRQVDFLSSALSVYLHYKGTFFISMILRIWIVNFSVLCNLCSFVHAQAGSEEKARYFVLLTSNAISLRKKLLWIC